jgi:homoserine acetyltransferase
MIRQGDFDVLELGANPLESGASLRGARLAYHTYGRLNACHT